MRLHPSNHPPPSVHSSRLADDVMCAVPTVVHFDFVRPRSSPPFSTIRHAGFALRPQPGRGRPCATHSGPVHQSLMLLETLEGGGRVVMNAGMPRFGVKPFNSHASSIVCAWAVACPTGRQHGRDEGLRGGSPAKARAAQRHLDDARDFFEAPPGHAVATQTFRPKVASQSVIWGCSPVNR